MKKKTTLKNFFPAMSEEVKAGVQAICDEMKADPAKVILKRLGACEEKRAAPKDKMDQLKDGEMSIIQYVSTRDMDRDYECLDPAGCVLTEFRKAMQVVECHDYFKPPIGKDEWIEADEYGIIAKTIYAPTERGREYFELRKGGFLSTSSVGAAYLETVSKGDPAWERTLKRYMEKWPELAKNAGKVRTIVTKWLLLEHSDVPVPANINALTVAVAKSMKLSDDLCKKLGVDMDEEDDEPTPEPVKPVQTVKLISPPRYVKLVSPPEKGVDIAELVKMAVMEAFDLARGKI